MPWTAYRHGQATGFLIQHRKDISISSTKEGGLTLIFNSLPLTTRTFVAKRQPLVQFMLRTEAETGRQ